jgi:hypothetical protein
LPPFLIFLFLGLKNKDTEPEWQSAKRRIGSKQATASKNKEGSIKYQTYYRNKLPIVTTPEGYGKVIAKYNNLYIISLLLLRRKRKIFLFILSKKKKEIFKLIG